MVSHRPRATLAVRAFFSLALLALTGAAQAATCNTNFCTLDLNSRIWVNNNGWGWESSPAGWSESITTNSSTAWRTDFNWPSGPNNNSVKAYPAAILGWHWGWHFQNTGLPVQLSANRNIDTNYAYSVNFGGGVGNVAYDIWLHTQSNPNLENPSDEIMIWVNSTGGAGPISQQAVISNLNIAGSTWNLHRGNIGWNVWSFVRTSNSGSGSFNIKAFTDYLRANQGMSSSKYLTSVQFGTEIFRGAGNLNVTNYNATVGGTSQPPGGGNGIVPNGTYRVVARHSGKALDVFGHQTQDGADVIQWAYGGGNNQRWTLTHLGNNVYQIMGVQSGKALAVASTSTANGTNVDIRTYNGATNHRWTISATSGGYFRLSPVSSPNSALDVNGAQTTDGANVFQWSWTGGNNQQWIFQAP
jgi:Glycosyl hydrolase family 12/Ricin-type beta-trefoil lectin domain-like